MRMRAPRWSRMADGDGRAALTLAEEIWRAARKGETFDAEKLQEVVQRRAPIYDKAQDSHYNLISALHKSVRGSDPDAALYYLCRMLDAGEDPLYLARRVVRMAVEDIGLADPQALVICNAAKDAYDFLGSPEGELAIAQAVIYIATAPKSNAAYRAYGAAMARRQGGRLAAAAQAHPQRADQADEVGRLRRGLRLRSRRAGGVLRPGLFPRRAWPASNSTIRPSAASSARSGSGWSIGRSCGRTGRRERVWTSARRHVRCCWPLEVLPLQPSPPRGAGRSALSACDGEAFTKPETPLIVQALSVRWFDANCSIVSNYKVNQTLYLQGRCNIAGRAETIPIMLEWLRGDRLRVGWNREPIQEMQRCR